jgi:hypothetical protein
MMYADAIPTAIGSVNAEILDYFKVAGTLAVVVVIAFAGLRFWLPKLTMGAHSRGPMHVVCRLTLEPRKMLYIVRAGSEYVLVAASDAGLQLLTSLDGEKIEAALQESAVKPASGFDFASLLPGRCTQPAERPE